MVTILAAFSVIFIPSQTCGTIPTEPIVPAIVIYKSSYERPSATPSAYMLGFTMTNYTRITHDERDRIVLLIQQGNNQKQIAVALGKINRVSPENYEKVRNPTVIVHKLHLLERMYGQ